VQIHAGRVGACRRKATRVTAVTSVEDRMNERLAIQIGLGAAAFLAAAERLDSLAVTRGFEAARESQSPGSKRRPVINVSFTPPEHHTPNK
jgi:hypothetical protein